MLKIAIVGCGKIADAHVSQILRINNCEIVGVCDSEPLMARQLYERFPVKRQFSDLEDLLNEAKPDVVHVTTPPESHFSIALRCLEWGCHVYVEKPFTLYEDEAQELIRIANDRKLKITVGHDDQFTHVARRMRALVRSGFLGHRPVHMESYYGYSFGNSKYAGALLGDKRHWARKLPGQLLHNTISHGIARIAEFLGESPEVLVLGFTSAFLKGCGENELVDELRVVVRDQDGTTAYFTFSSQIRPVMHQFRLYGDTNGLILDQDQETLVRVSGARSKRYVEHFITPVTIARQYLSNIVTNVSIFLARDFQEKAGMKHLIESFYCSIVDGGPLPISYREILLTAHIMDAVFAQLEERRRQYCTSGQAVVGV